LKNKLIFSLLFLTVILLNGQNKRPEIAIMNCIYDNYLDEGIALKKIIFDFENHLIQEKKLLSTSGSSYLKLVQQMANDTFLPLEIFVEFSNKWSKIKDPKEIEIGKCREPILGSDLLLIEAQMKELIRQKKVNEPLNMASLLAKVLTKEDLELDYFKIKLFVFMATSAHIGNNYVSDDVLPAIYDDENAFTISINAKNEIYSNNKLVNVNELGSLLRNYLVNNTSKSIVLVHYSRNTKYKNYIDLQQSILAVIEELKQEYALEKFNNSFNKLTDTQKDQVNKMYVVNLREVETN
tara:strand:+ start:202460 stop:203344 length:885 start_codon:yes stop_codon:yes gene_type:complete